MMDKANTDTTMQQQLHQLTEATLRIAQAMESMTGQDATQHSAVVDKLNNNFSDIQRILASSPIAPLLSDDTISDILINGPSEIYIDQAGHLQKTNIVFSNHAELMRMAESIAQSIGRTIDPKRPMVDARLKDGSRVNIITPPLVLDGVSISIRKFPKKEITLDVLVENGSMTTQMAQYLKLCAQNKLNILISGGTGTGKTTLLNAISRYVPHHERIVTIEDTAEISLQQPHVVRMESKEPAIMGDRSDTVSTEDLLRNALRMRPDRIIVGEVRGTEAYDMIQAMNTGHEGSMATIHANTPRDSLTRLENMLGPMLPGAQPSSIRKQIVSAVHMVVQLIRCEDGKRRISHITDVIGLEGDVPTLQDIFILRHGKLSRNAKHEYRHEWSNVMPRNAYLAAAIRAEGIFK